MLTHIFLKTKQLLFSKSTKEGWSVSVENENSIQRKKLLTESKCIAVKLVTFNYMTEDNQREKIFQKLESS